MRVPREWKDPIADNRMLILSTFAKSEKRVTKDLALARNLIVAALADEVVFAHVTPGGQLDQLRKVIAGWQVPCCSL
jgi:hypothetical protein